MGRPADAPSTHTRPQNNTTLLLARRAERAKARATLRALASLLPARARLLLRGADEPPQDVPAAQLRPGDLLRVLPGDRVPVDGLIEGGDDGALDESMLTGEAALVPKRRGDAVTAGAVSWGGALDVRATAVGAACTLAQMSREVEAAQARAAPVQRLADTISGPFAYGVMAASAATFVFWAGYGVQRWPDALLWLDGGATGCAAAAAAAAAPRNF